MSGFELDESNQYIKKIYREKDNYKMIHNECNTKQCIILFSGNGLYYPDTVETFKEIVIERDRYEWANVINHSTIQETYELVILVRDVYKTWYQKGINVQLDSIDKLLFFLKEKTIGYQVVTCGNSAGGYMATIAGSYLNADRVFNFGGQWDLSCEKGYFLNNAKDGQYYNIVEFANKNIIWFYSAYNEYDVEQKVYLDKYIDRIYTFAIASKYHGDYLLYPCYKNILAFSMNEIEVLNKKYYKKIVSQKKIAGDCLRGAELGKACMDDIIRKHKSLQILQKWFKGRNSDDE